jgi:membrane associated rhomboid family serine protease
MGIYDRGYYRDEDRGPWFGGRSIVVNLIILNVAIYVADMLFEGRLTDWLSLRSDLFRRPWQFYQLLTYGFVHDPSNVLHIVLNMFFLWIFGSELESLYGRNEFLRIYLTAIVIAGLAWVAFATAMGSPPIPLVGASGGIMALMIIFVLHFPMRMFYIWGIIPLPAWALGAISVLMDVAGVVNQQSSQVAYVAHLAGVAFGAIYYQSKMNLGRLVPVRLSGSMFRLRPKLRIHDPARESRDLNAQVDQILEKISREGEASLTRKERRTLEEASRRYQRRRE